MGKPKSKEWYVQCCLRHTDGRETVAWIPQKYAEEGKRLVIKDDIGWQVRAAYYSMREQLENLIVIERDYIRQRKASDR